MLRSMGTMSSYDILLRSCGGGMASTACASSGAAASPSPSSPCPRFPIIGATFAALAAFALAVGGDMLTPEPEQVLAAAPCRLARSSVRRAVMDMASERACHGHKERVS